MRPGYRAHEEAHIDKDVKLNMWVTSDEEKGYPQNITVNWVGFSETNNQPPWCLSDPEMWCYAGNYIEGLAATIAERYDVGIDPKSLWWVDVHIACHKPDPTWPPAILAANEAVIAFVESLEKHFFNDVWEQVKHVAFPKPRYLDDDYLPTRYQLALNATRIYPGHRGYQDG